MELWPQTSSTTGHVPRLGLKRCVLGLSLRSPVFGLHLEGQVRGLGSKALGLDPAGGSHLLFCSEQIGRQCCCTLALLTLCLILGLVSPDFELGLESHVLGFRQQVIDLKGCGLDSKSATTTTTFSFVNCTTLPE